MQVFGLFPNIITTHTSNITQVGNYLRFDSFKEYKRDEVELEFSLFIAGYTFQNKSNAILDSLDFYLNILQEKRVNSIERVKESLIVNENVRFVGGSEGLFVYKLSFAMRVRL